MKKTIIISGGLGVLGQSYAKGLSEDGYAPLLLDVKAPVSKNKVIGDCLVCDISKEQDVAKVDAYIKKNKLRVYGLINNASCQPPGFTNELEDYSAETFRSVLEVNLLGSFLLSKMAIPHMKKHKEGIIINIGSIQSVVAPSFEIYEGMGITSPLSYSVAKAGMVHFCKWIAAKYGSWNIRCNAVSPGGLGDSQKGGSKFAQVYAKKTPLGRMAHSSDVAQAVRFLMSDKAQYITGQNMIVDGGWTIS